VDIGVARAEAQDGGAAKAMSPDLSAFVAHGGKLITYPGTTDGLIPYGNSVNYYESVVAGGGDRIKENVALYLVPGMDHCTGGEGRSMSIGSPRSSSGIGRARNPARSTRVTRR
jgi:feruloyl esterase